ncbi:hypothetical protein [Streptomyces sp. NPDC002550]
MAQERVEPARRGPGRPGQEHVTAAMYRRRPTEQDLVIAAAESRIGPLSAVFRMIGEQRLPDETRRVSGGHDRPGGRRPAVTHD